MTENAKSGADRAVGGEGTRVFSYGGGVQSTAALVLAARGTIDFPTFLFANVGDDSEQPATITFVREVAIPYAAAHGVNVIEIAKTKRDGSPAPTLLQRLEQADSRSVPIPVKMSRNGAPGTRSCTSDHKIRVIHKWLRQQGVTAALPAIMGVGISTDEIQRVKPGTDPRSPLQSRVYPLIDLGLDRAACAEVIRSEGLPVPGKSSCWFCPMHKRSEWRRMRRDEPELFAKSVALERLLNERRAGLGKDEVWFSGALRPLDEAIVEAQPALFGDDCESGYCMT